MLDGNGEVYLLSSSSGIMFLRSGNFFNPKKTRSFQLFPLLPSLLCGRFSLFLSPPSVCLYGPWSFTMNPSPAAVPKAAAIPSRLLRSSRQYSNQTRCVRSTTQTRGHHVPTASSSTRNFRASVYSKNDPLSLSARVGSSFDPFIPNSIHMDDS